MTIDDVALRVAESLGATGVPFMLVGGFSSKGHSSSQSKPSSANRRRSSVNRQSWMV